MAASEVFVVLDDVPFRRHYYQNRAKYLDAAGQVRWLTLPVHGSRTRVLRDTAVVPGREISKVRRTLRYRYRHSPYFESLWPSVDSQLFAEMPPSLADIAVASIVCLLKLLGCQTPQIERSSAIPHGSERTERIISLINHFKATVFLPGWGATLNPRVHRLEAFESHGIQIRQLRIDIVPPAHRFTITPPGVSTLHWLFLHGPNEIRPIIEHMAGYFRRYSET